MAASPPLWDRYVRPEGRVHLTGLQALVRLALDQIRCDARDGRRLRALFSGYPGSPLAGLDSTLRSLRPLLEPAGVRLVPALNEEIAASTIAGTQLLEVFPHSGVDGVLGLWFGKAPGVDRALDALRHSNFTGSARFGGALALVGDDPFCKSSSLPSHSEHAFAHAFAPLLAPADAAEVLSLGRHAIEISRYAGVWAGLKIVADVADAGRVFDLPADPVNVARPKFEVMGRSFRPRFDTGLLPPQVVEIERDLVYARLEAVRRYAHANGLNPIHVRHPSDAIGLVASGPLYRELETALAMLRLDDAELERLGLRLLKMELLHPIEPRRLREFADGLDEIVVVDARSGYLEEQIRTALYNEVDHPLVIGQRTPEGEPWIARRGEVSAGTLALDLASHLAVRLGCSELERSAAPLRASLERARSAPPPSRPPHFCSGCPHSSSTRRTDGAAVGGGIGCHTMALLMDRGVEYVGAMGSEGAHWIGLEAYTDTDHLFQNLGDGTYFHSGRLAVQACVAAGVKITFKLLYNGVVAMTGGQVAAGAKPVADLVRDLLADGVRVVVAMSDDAALLRLAAADARVRCIAREQWEQAMREIRAQPGVTALVYDAVCANHKQRLERRGLLAPPASEVVIHQDVCEGCGDCGVRSSCVSLRPVATALGRKTRIHATSCSDDRACLDGDCPAFLSVESPRAPAPPLDRWLERPLPAPEPPSWRGRYEIFLVGIGSTGVVTVDALLVRAAELDGLYALHMDQAGLAQRGGKVVCHCVVSREPVDGGAHVGWGRADAVLAFDPLGATDAAALVAFDRERTRAVAHADTAPTGREVSDPAFEPPDVDSRLERLRSETRSLFALPAEALAEAALGSTLPANVVLLGAALQHGLLPLSEKALEEAIRDNGVAIEDNLRALQLGRAVAADPTLTARVLADASPPAVGETDVLAFAEGHLGATWQRFEATLSRCASVGASRDLRRRAAAFAVDLMDYQDGATASRYLERVRVLVEAESRSNPCSTALAQTAARELYRVTAAKDEYEVARLLLRGPFRRWLERSREGPLALRYHLQPPLLRALGLRRKLAFGRWIEPLLHALVALRRLRGTRLDPFGFLPPRRLEREIQDWYAGVLEALAGAVTTDNLESAVRIAARAARIRGYESIKATRFEEIRPVVERELGALQRPCRDPETRHGDHA
jgi:indolepyruvate ferredoxin oxidoreductase